MLHLRCSPDYDRRSTSEIGGECRLVSNLKLHRVSALSQSTLLHQTLHNLPCSLQQRFSVGDSVSLKRLHRNQHTVCHAEASRSAPRRQDQRVALLS